MINEGKYVGCFLGLAIADSYGALYEGGILERQLWRLIGRTSGGKKRYTDDTQMSLDIALSFLKNQAIDQNHLAQTFASSYKWSRGYGPSAAKLLKGIGRGRRWQDLNRKKFKEGSMGNGAAMRAPIVALCFPLNGSILKDNIQKTAEITHAHPLAIEGAHYIAVATCMALKDDSSDKILEYLCSICDTNVYRTKLNSCIDFCLAKDIVGRRELKKKLGNGIIATESCVTALYFGLKYRENRFEEMLGEIFRLGGDADTIGAMAGGIWGAFNGEKDIANLAKEVENIELIESLAKRLYRSHPTQFL